MGAYAYEAITVSSTALGLTASNYAESPSTRGTVKRVLITVETDQVRFTTDGTTPTSSIGHLVDARQTITLEGRDDIAKFKAIRVTTDASLKVTYEN